MFYVVLTKCGIFKLTSATLARTFTLSYEILFSTSALARHWLHSRDWSPRRNIISSSWPMFAILQVFKPDFLCRRCGSGGPSSSTLYSLIRWLNTFPSSQQRYTPGTDSITLQVSIFSLNPSTDSYPTTLLSPPSCVAASHYFQSSTLICPFASPEPGVFSGNISSVPCILWWFVAFSI
jgi:hypothetical protein